MHKAQGLCDIKGSLDMQTHSYADTAILVI